MEQFKTLALFVFSEKCYDKMFLEFDFLDLPCFKATLSKALGIAVIAGSLLVKLPQVIKIVKNKSGEGINIYSVILDLFAITATVAYSFVKGFPFSSWGDGSFLAVQTAAIGALVFIYSGATYKAVLFLIAYLSLCYILMGGITPVDFLWSMQAFNVPILLIGKSIQAVTNYKNGSTGQLSAVTCFMLLSGSLARIFTSIQETGDSIIILTYAVSSFANSIIVAQLLYYWNSEEKKSKKQTKPIKNKKLKKTE